MEKKPANFGRIAGSGATALTAQTTAWRAVTDPFGPIRPRLSLLNLNWRMSDRRPSQLANQKKKQRERAKKQREKWKDKEK